MARLSIAFVCNEYPPCAHGGIGTFTQTAARALVRLGHQVRVIGSYAQLQAGLAHEEDEGVQVFRLSRPKHDLASVRARMQMFRMLRSWARVGEIDLVEVPDDGWGAAWPSLGVPLITRVHGSATYFCRELRRPNRWLTYWLEWASIHRSDFWCTVSQYAGQKTAEAFNLRPPHAISYVPVDLDDTIPAARDKNKVIFTGTLTVKKGVVSLFDAWRAVRQRCPEAELHVLGKDTLYREQSMEKFLLSRLDECSRIGVHFHGHVPRERLLRELRTARVAVFPSFAEAFAFAPIEAMACGCPTIYSWRTSGPELMRSNIDGILINPDDTEELAAAIVHVLSDDDLAHKLGKAARDRVAGNFTTQQLMPPLEEFYHRCVRQFGSRRHLNGPLCSSQS